ncbi:MAG: glycosyl hydrolase family 57, partial [Planctomycetota bacterium]|nr:glycosyl hydrolase family 57 [Planctomycetota bacterium]
MMHEFPDGFRSAFRQAGDTGAVGMTGTEYLELLASRGISDEDFEPIRAIHHHKIFSHPAFESGRPLSQADLDRVLSDIRAKDPLFHVEGSSWTSNLSWVRGYQNVLDPIRRLSEAFHAKYSSGKVDQKSYAYRRNLLYLLLSQTSCFRYWGQGRWTDYARELCRRGMEGLKD